MEGWGWVEKFFDLNNLEVVIIRFILMSLMMATLKSMIYKMWRPSYSPTLTVVSWRWEVRLLWEERGRVPDLNNLETPVSLKPTHDHSSITFKLLLVMDYLFTSAVDFWRPRKSACMEDLSKSFSIYMQHSDISSYIQRGQFKLFSLFSRWMDPLINQWTNLRICHNYILLNFKTFFAKG